VKCHKYSVARYTKLGLDEELYLGFRKKQPTAYWGLFVNSSMQPGAQVQAFWGNILPLEMDAVCPFEILVLMYHNMDLHCHEPQILCCKLQFANMVEGLTTEPEY
jgi:hypothetical protein